MRGRRRERKRSRRRSYFLAAGVLGVSLRTPCSWMLLKCWYRGNPPPLQQTTTAALQKQAPVCWNLCLRPKQSATVSSQLTSNFLHRPRGEGSAVHAPHSRRPGVHGPWRLCWVPEDPLGPLRQPRVCAQLPQLAPPLLHFLLCHRPHVLLLPVAGPRLLRLRLQRHLACRHWLPPSPEMRRVNLLPDVAAATGHSWSAAEEEPEEPTPPSYLSLANPWNSLLTPLRQNSVAASRYDRILLRISTGSLGAD